MEDASLGKRLPSLDDALFQMFKCQEGQARSPVTVTIYIFPESSFEAPAEAKPPEGRLMAFAYLLREVETGLNTRTLLRSAKIICFFRLNSVRP